MVPHGTNKRSEILKTVLKDNELKLWDELSKALDGTVHDYLARIAVKKLADIKNDISDFRMPIVGYQTLKMFGNFERYRIETAIKDIKYFSSEISMRLDIKTTVSLYATAFCEIIGRGGIPDDLEKRVYVFDKAISNCEVVDSLIEEQEEMCDNWIAFLDRNIGKIKTVEFEPSFGRASQKIGGADADIIINDCLIDFKSGAELRDLEKNIEQICGYFLLSQSCFKDKERKIKRLFLCYPRYDDFLEIEPAINEQLISDFDDYLENPYICDNGNMKEILEKANMYSFIIPQKDFTFLTIKHFRGQRIERGVEFAYIVFRGGRAVLAKKLLSNVNVRIPEWFENENGITNSMCEVQPNEAEIRNRVENDLRGTKICTIDSESTVRTILTRNADWNPEIVSFKKEFENKLGTNFTIDNLGEFARDWITKPFVDTLEETMLAFETAMILLGSNLIKI